MPKRKQQPIGKLPLELFREDRGTELVSPAAVLGLYGSIPGYYQRACSFISKRADRLHDVARINQVWRAIAALLQFLAPCLLKGVCKHPSHGPTIKGLQSLFHWFIQAFAYLGFDTTTSYVKAMTDWGEFYSLYPKNLEDRPPAPRGMLGARSGWLTFPWALGHFGVLAPTVGPFKKKLVHPLDWYSSANFQLHLAKRGFGLPGKPQRTKALRKHMQFLSEPVTVPPEVLSAAYQFSLNYTRERVGLKFEFHTTLSASACLQKSRTLGGRSQFVFELLEEFFDVDPVITVPCRKALFGKNQYFDIFGRKVNVSQFDGSPYKVVEFGKPVLRIPLLRLLGVSTPLPNSRTSMWVQDLEKITCLILFQFLLSTGDISLPPMKKPWSRNPMGRFFDLWIEDPNLDPDQITFQTPLYKATPVDDVGLKARVITVGHGAWVTLGHLFRTAMYSCMKGDPETIFVDFADGSFAEWFHRVNKVLPTEGKTFLSVDLTSATDTFCGDICRQLARGAVDAFKPVDKPAWRMMAILVRRNLADGANIIYPKDISDQPVVQRRGVLMGNAESWVILNLYNRFFIRLSETCYRISDSTIASSWSSPVVQTALSNIVDKAICVSKRCGDDQVSLGPTIVHQSYLSVITLSGAIPSPGTNVISDRFMTFTQSLAWLSDEGKVDWIDIVRIISLVDWKGLTRLPEKKETPRLWFRGLSYFQALRWWGINEWQKTVKKGLLLFGQWLCSRFIRECTAHGLEPFLPMPLGGLNFPHPTGRECRHVRPRVLQTIAFLLRDDQRPETFQKRSNLDIWNLHSAESLIGVRSRRVADRVFSVCFCEESRLDLSIEGSLGNPGFFDLNQWRNLMKINVPLTEISLKILRNSFEELKSLGLPPVTPIGLFWKEVTSRIREMISRFTPPDSIQDPEQRLKVKSALFRSRIKEIRRSAGPLIDSFDPHTFSSRELSFLESRMMWADHYFFVTQALREKIEQYIAYFVEEARVTKK
jgi:hypothetical protein